MDIEYGNPNALRWMMLVPAGLLLLLWSALRSKRFAERFATANLVDRLVVAGRRLRRTRSALLLAATIALLALALVDIRWGRIWRDVPQRGIEVVFLLDVSRSMLAEDATPNRLVRAKQQIRDVVNEMHGDRIGLVLFAGEVRLHVPLTSHYEHFKQSLDAAGPHHLDRGGSRLGDAIRIAADSFLGKTDDHKAIVIFSDGEDQQSDPVQAAAEALDKQGIRIYCIGLGDSDRGARIPIGSSGGKLYLQHQGQEVWSKLNGDILRQVAEQADGLYIPAGTRQVNMAEFYQRSIANLEQTEFESARIHSYQARFQWFLAPAVLLLLIECALGSGPSPQTPECDTKPAES